MIDCLLFSIETYEGKDKQACDSDIDRLSLVSGRPAIVHQCRHLHSQPDGHLCGWHSMSHCWSTRDIHHHLHLWYALYCLLSLALSFHLNYNKGIDKFFDNLKEMTQWHPKVLLKSHLVVTITALAPAVIMIILYKEMSVLFKSEAQLKYGTYDYPHWAILAGWGMVSTSVIAIPLGVGHQFLKTMCSREKSFCKRLRMLTNPTELWWANATENEKPNTLAILTRDSIDVNNKTSRSCDTLNSNTAHFNTGFVCTEF